MILFFRFFSFIKKYCLAMFLNFSFLLLFTTHIFTSLVWAAPAPVGVLEQKQGAVEVQHRVSSGFVALPVQSQIYEGDVLRTGAAGKAKVLFRDGTQLHLQEKTLVRIDEYVRGEPSLISVLLGSIRARISKSINGDLKAVIRTKSTAMGVRGTDFQVMVPPGGASASLLTYEGRVEMAKIENSGRGENLQRFFEPGRLAGRSVIVNPGEVSLVTKEQSLPSLPVRLAPLQVEVLERTTTVDVGRSRDNTALANLAQINQAPSAVMPLGVPPQALAASPRDIFPAAAFQNGEQKKVIDALVQQQINAQQATPDASGVMSGSQAAPTAGGALDLRTGAYLPPPPGSQYDALTKTFSMPVAPIMDLAQVRPIAAGTDLPRAGDAPRPPVGEIVFSKSMTPAVQALGQPVAAAMTRLENTYGGTDQKLLTVRNMESENIAQNKARAGQDKTEERRAAEVGSARPVDLPFFEAGTPLYPQRDNLYCPPYCDPRFVPGTYPALPDRGGPRTTVTFRVRGE